MLKFKKPHPWFRTRGYLHFDRPISFTSAKKIVTNPKKVASHSFYPLINYSVESKKIKKDKASGNIVTKLKQRPISYSSHVDSHIYAYYSNVLANLYEMELTKRCLGDSVLAFRSLGKSNIEFAHEAFTTIKDFGECGGVALDLSKFFDTLDHSILKTQWSNLIACTSLPPDHYNVFKSLTKFSTVDKLTLYNLLDISANNPKNGRTRICNPLDFRTKVRQSVLIKLNKNSFGIPQGTPISALLSNIYMIDFDSDMKKYVDQFGGKYFRYCDDMLFIVPINERDKVAGFARQALKDLKVDINTEKTELRTFILKNDTLTADRSLQYLGFLFDGINVYLRSASLAKYSERMRKGVSLAKATMRKRNKQRMLRDENIKSLFKYKLYRKYSHLGSRNFITYGLRAAEVMESKTIRQRFKPLWGKLQEEMK
jgi:RNA-directed DNA polymerase